MHFGSSISSFLHRVALGWGWRYGSKIAQWAIHGVGDIIGIHYCCWQDSPQRKRGCLGSRGAVLKSRGRQRNSRVDYFDIISSFTSKKGGSRSHGHRPPKSGLQPSRFEINESLTGLFIRQRVGKVLLKLSFNTQRKIFEGMERLCQFLSKFHMRFNNPHRMSQNTITTILESQSSLYFTESDTCRLQGS